MRQHQRRCGIAGDHREIRRMLLQQATEQRYHPRNDLILAAMAIGKKGVVGDVDVMHVGPRAHDFAQDREAAKAGIEHEDGLGWAHCRKAWSNPVHQFRTIPADPRRNKAARTLRDKPVTWPLPERSPVVRTVLFPFMIRNTRQSWGSARQWGPQASMRTSTSCSPRSCLRWSRSICWRRSGTISQDAMAY